MLDRFHYKRKQLVALILLVSCAASVLTPTGIMTETWTLNGKLDAETVTSKQGQIYYVATNGDDNNPGTEAQPFYTIQRAADTAQEPGDTVIIRSGTYAPFRIRYSGAENQPITFKNYPGERPVIAGSPNTHGITIQENTSHRNSIGWLVIDGLEVSGAGGDGIKGYNVHHLTIKNCHIHHSNDSNILLASGAHHITLDRNRLHESGQDEDGTAAHDIYANGNYWTVTNNLLYASPYYSVQLAAYNQDVKNYIQPDFGNLNHWIIANNTFAFTKLRSAIYIWDGYGGQCDDIRIFNNIFYRNAELGGVSGFPNGVRFSRTYDNIINATIYNNLYQGDAPFIVNPGDGEYQEFDNIEADPRFVATDTDDPANNDFHLLLGSLAIDAGTAQDAPSHDFESNLRPQGGGYDIGAYEFPFNTFLPLIMKGVSDPAGGLN